jgi:DNA recombination protein RmuC
MTLVELAVVTAVAAGAAALIAVLLVRRRPGEGEVTARMEAHSARLDRLADALGRQSLDDQALRQGLVDTRRAVDDLRARDEERRERDEESRAAIRRLETTFLGAATRGAVGENVVWEALSVLPPDMVDTGFRVNGKQVEFALRLPDGRRLPVDSKWAGVAEIEALEEAEGPDRQRLAGSVERLVAGRAREVAKYLDPSLTAPFAVAAVPDAAYGVLRRAHLEAYGDRVLLVPYSGALPVLLALYALCCRLGVDAADVGALVSEVEGALAAIERDLENRVERGAQMTQNAAAEIRVQIGRARGAAARTRAGGAIDGDHPRLRAVEAVTPSTSST